MSGTALISTTFLVLVLYLTTPTNAALSEDEEVEIIRAHNFYRAKASPQPTDMVALEWDEQLAALAQFWAVQCTLEPNENRHEQSTDYDYVGEIMHGSANYSINLTSMVFEWFFDGRMYNYELGYCVNENGEAEEDLEDCERYVQLVWAKTVKFGCGSYRCEEIMGLEEEVDEGQTPLMVACYYGPGGGFAGVQPYSSGGEACSQCPDGYEECQNKLCTLSGAPPTVSPAPIAATLLLFTILSLWM